MWNSGGELVRQIGMVWEEKLKSRILFIIVIIKLNIAQSQFLAYKVLKLR